MNVSAFIPIKKFSSSKNRLANIISSSEREILAASMAKKTIDTLNNSKICNSITVVIGKDGVEKIEQIDLDDKEKKEFMHSIDAVKALWEAASKIDPDLSE